ncbi:ribosome biogenesis factor YjgA [Shewanella marina]|uniref:ribosome biogenesis factor YjgA n=1 Tax=Shewanella marina TaxID=487319 RepID=UPI00046F83CF|nr:ribosome biogenesis factor YjgA [Shewanella marina]
MNIIGDSEHFKQPYDQDDDYISRTEFKRESEAYQLLGDRLVALSKSQLAKIVLDEFIMDSIVKTRSIKPKTEAMRRHMQYIGKLMRNVDLEDVEAQVNRVLNRGNEASAQNHMLEKAKDRLLADGDAAIQDLLEQHPQLERQKLRQLIRQANKELAKAPEAPSKSAAEIIKYLRAETVA